MSQNSFVETYKTVCDDVNINFFFGVSTSIIHRKERSTETRNEAENLVDGGRGREEKSKTVLQLCSECPTVLLKQQFRTFPYKTYICSSSTVKRRRFRFAFFFFKNVLPRRVLLIIHETRRHLRNPIVQGYRDRINVTYSIGVIIHCAGERSAAHIPDDPSSGTRFIYGVSYYHFFTVCPPFFFLLLLVICMGFAKRFSFFPPPPRPLGRPFVLSRGRNTRCTAV